MKILDRRKFFKGVGSGALLLNPILNNILHAETRRYAKRFIFFFTANGTRLENFRPPQGNHTPGSIQLSHILSPLEQFKNQLTVLQGVHIRTGSPGDNHVKGVLSGLTAINNNDGDAYTNNERTGFNKGESLDQFIARHHGNQPILAGVQTGAHFFAHLSSKGNNQPQSPDSDPFRLHKELFGNVVENPDAADIIAKNKTKRSILDFAIKDIAKMRNNLPVKLAANLSDHLDAVRTLENNFNIPDTIGCTIPELGHANIDDNASFPDVIDMQIKNVAFGMACGNRSSAILMCGHGVDNTVHEWVDVNKEAHSLSHDLGNEAKVTRINHWYAGKFNKLLQTLASIPEGEGTMLDNSIVVWGQDLSEGRSHDLFNIPYVLAGGANGLLPGGRYFNWGDDSKLSHGCLLVSIANAMGIPITSYNDGKHPLPDGVFKTA